MTDPTPSDLLDAFPAAQRRELDRLAAECMDGVSLADPEALDEAHRELGEWVDHHGLASWVADALRVLDAMSTGDGSSTE